MADELIDVYDENNNSLGKQATKSEAHVRGLWHRVVHVLVYNSRKEVLLQLRAKEKELFPNLWDVSVGGHIGAGEDPADSALREMEEELGIRAQKNELEPVSLDKSKTLLADKKDFEFVYCFFCRLDEDASKLVLQKSEVAEAKFFDIDWLERDLQQNPSHYVKPGQAWFDVLNALKRKFH